MTQSTQFGNPLIWLLTFGLFVTSVSTVWFLIRRDERKRYSRLKAGDSVITKWTVDAARWEWFRTVSAEWDTRKGVRPNQVKLQHPAGDGGVHIVVANDGIAINDAFFTLEKDVSIRTFDECMEFDQLYVNPRGGNRHIVVRVPLPPNGAAHATAISEAYRAARVAAAWTPRTKVIFLLALFGGLAAITAVVTVVVELLEPYL